MKPWTLQSERIWKLHFKLSKIVAQSFNFFCQLATMGDNVFEDDEQYSSANPPLGFCCDDNTAWHTLSSNMSPISDACHITDIGIVEEAASGGGKDNFWHAKYSGYANHIWSSSRATQGCVLDMWGCNQALSRERCKKWRLAIKKSVENCTTTVYTSYCTLNVGKFANAMLRSVFFLAFIGIFEHW